MTATELKAKCEALAGAGDAQAAATLALFAERDKFKAAWDENFKDMVRAQEAAQKYLGQLFWCRVTLAAVLASHPCREDDV
jgi:hypothetical protein